MITTRQFVPTSNNELQIPYEIGQYIVDLVFKEPKSMKCSRISQKIFFERGPDPEEIQLKQGLILSVNRENLQPRSLLTRYGKWTILPPSSESFKKVMMTLFYALDLRCYYKTEEKLCYSIGLWKGTRLVEPIVAKNWEYISQKDVEKEYRRFRPELSMRNLMRILNDSSLEYIVSLEHLELGKATRVLKPRNYRNLSDFFPEALFKKRRQFAIEISCLDKGYHLINKQVDQDISILLEGTKPSVTIYIEGCLAKERRIWRVRELETLSVPVSEGEVMTVSQCIHECRDILEKANEIHGIFNVLVEKWGPRLTIEKKIDLRKIWQAVKIIFSEDLNTPMQRDFLVADLRRQNKLFTLNFS